MENAQPISDSNQNSNQNTTQSKHRQGKRNHKRDKFQKKSGETSMTNTSESLPLNEQLHISETNSKQKHQLHVRKNTTDAPGVSSVRDVAPQNSGHNPNYRTNEKRDKKNRSQHSSPRPLSPLSSIDRPDELGLQMPNDKSRIRTPANQRPTQQTIEKHSQGDEPNNIVVEKTTTRVDTTEDAQVEAFTQHANVIVSYRESIELVDQQVIFHGPRGMAVRILSRAENSDSNIEKLLLVEFKNEDIPTIDRQLLIELVFGVLRWQTRLDWILTGFYHGEFNKCITPVKNAMRIALYQLLMLDKISPSIAINDSVSIIRRLKDDRSAGIINSVLKNILRNINNIRYPSVDENKELYLSVVCSHPLWLVKRWVSQYGHEQAEIMMTRNNDRPAIYMRINTLKSTVDDVHQWLRNNGVTFEISNIASNYIRLNALMNVDTLDIYKQGQISRMNPSIQMILNLANLKKGLSVLELGDVQATKVMAIAQELEDVGQVVTIAKYKEQLEYVSHHANRQGFTCIQTHVADPAAFESEQKFDVVFVSAPSSEIGLYAKKPYKKWKSEIDSVRIHNKMQKAMLDVAVASLKNYGRIIYSVYSLEPEETTNIISAFLEKYPKFTVVPITTQHIPADMIDNSWLRIQPHLHKIDSCSAICLQWNS